MKPDVLDIQRAAIGMRNAFDQGELSMTNIWRSFPRGACDHASEMLGQYFIDCGLGDWECVYRPGDIGHTWLEQGSVLVDITADQFNGRPAFGEMPAVIVTRRRAWHDRHFPGASRRAVQGLGYFSRPDLVAAAHADYAVLRNRADRYRA